MSRERHDAELSEYAAPTDLDDELKAALAVSPSPGFEARVLRRVAERGSTRSGLSYVPLAAAAALVLVTTFAVLMTRQDLARPVAPTLRVATPPPPAAAPDAQTALPAGAQSARPHVPQVERQSRRTVAHARRRVGGPSRPAAAEPEVIVPREHAEAVRRLIRAVAEGRFEAPPTADQSLAGVPEPLPVPRLSVQPIVVSAVEERGGPPPVVRPQ